MCTIDEIRKRLIDLENEITELVSEFEEKTKCQVDDISLERETYKDSTWKTKTVIKASIKVNVHD